MISLILLLLLIGLGLILIDSIVPGDIFVIIGIVLISTAILIGFSAFSPIMGLGFASLSLLLTAAALWTSYRFLARWISLKPYQPKSTPDTLPTPGQQGRVLHALRPSGMIEIEGKRYPARAEISIHEIRTGENVEVVALDGGTVIVKKLEKP
jgi:membrane-bound ClpP family serine protease